MYFKTIYKTLGTTGTEEDESKKKKKKLQEIVPAVALTNFISVFQSQCRSFIVPIKAATVLKNALIHKMGLYPE